MILPAPRLLLCVTALAGLAIAVAIWPDYLVYWYTLAGLTAILALLDAVTALRLPVPEVARSVLLGADSPVHRVGIRYDVVLIARPAALEVSFADLRAEASLAALRLARLKP